MRMPCKLIFFLLAIRIFKYNIDLNFKELYLLQSPILQWAIKIYLCKSTKYPYENKEQFLNLSVVTLVINIINLLSVVFVMTSRFIRTNKIRLGLNNR